MAVAKHPAKCPKCGGRLEYESAVDERIVCPSCQVLLSVPGKAKLSDRVDPLVGETLGEFGIMELLGRGGMGAVYKARQASLDRLVAIKILPRAFSRDASFIERFSREARDAAAVNHPNIIQIYAVGEARGFQYIAMEIVDGESLAELLKREGRLAPERAIDMLKQVAAALARAHGAGIVHRDIKPSNILLAPDGLVKVADFGLAKRSGTDVSVTHTGALMGTPLYFPPEAARGERYDARSDLYSLGATFYHVLAGRPPFEGGNAIELAVKHTEGQVPPLAEAAPEASPALCRIIHRLLRKSPGERYQSAEELLEALGRVEARRTTCQAEPTRTMPGTARASLVERHHAKEQRRKKGILLAAGGALAALLLVVGLLLFSGKGEVAQPPLGRRSPPGEAGPAPAPQPPTPATQPPTPPSVVKPPSTKPATRGAQPPPAVPAWEAAWNETVAKAKALAQQGRYGEATKSCQTLADLFDDAQLKDRAQKAVSDIYAQADAAYGGLERQAKQLLTEKKFEEARAALRPVVERFGLPLKADEAKKLLAEIDAAEKGKQPEPQPPQPQPQPAEDEKATAARKAEAEKRRLADERYAKALEQAEALVQAWDFPAAADALAKLSFEEKDLAARLATRRDELDRLAKLKARMIQRINSAQPPLRRSSLVITGINADLVKADEKGITARLLNGKTELHEWKTLTARSVRQLVQVTIDKQSADEWLAAGLLLLCTRTPTTEHRTPALDPAQALAAEEAFDKARALGASVDRYLDPLAGPAFAKAKALLDKKQYTEAEAALSTLEAKYAKTPWLDAHRADLAAAREQIKASLATIEADKLYAQAVRLFKDAEAAKAPADERKKNDLLLELKAVVEKLRTDFPKTPPVTEEGRKPNFAELLEKTRTVGKVITVRKDGKGDFKAVQDAINAAPPNSLIEIQDNGPYNEFLVIPAQKQGIGLRGKKGFWPLITSAGLKSETENLVEVNAPGTCLEHLILAHTVARDEKSLQPDQGRTIRSRAPELKVENCAILGGGAFMEAAAELKSFILLGPFERPSATLKGAGIIGMENGLLTGVFTAGVLRARCCTIVGRMVSTAGLGGIAGTVGPGPNDSVIRQIESPSWEQPLQWCAVYGKPPVLGGLGLGANCLTSDPQFRDPANYDYRLRPTSPCRRKASDGGDLGCRWTPEMVELLEKVLDLRKKGIIKF
jgi:serine/threonine protein kinase